MDVGAGVRKPCFWEPKAENLGTSRPLNTKMRLCDSRNIIKSSTFGVQHLLITAPYPASISPQERFALNVPLTICLY